MSWLLPKRSHNNIPCYWDIWDWRVLSLGDRQLSQKAKGMGSYCFCLCFRGLCVHTLPLKTYFLSSASLGFSADWSLYSHTAGTIHLISQMLTIVIYVLSWWKELGDNIRNDSGFRQTEFKSWLLPRVSMTLSNLFNYPWLISLSY